MESKVRLSEWHCGAVMNGPTFEVRSYKPKLPSLIKINAYFEEAAEYL
jgi:hypothetical protein